MKTFRYRQLIEEQDILKQRVMSLSADLRLAKRLAVKEEEIRREILGIKNERVTLPTWATKPRKPSSHWLGTPVAMLSDTHGGEVVNPKEIGGCNEYNLDIFDRRLEIYTNNLIEMLKDKFPGHYAELWLLLGGDLDSGDIHEEHLETNELPWGGRMLRLVPAFLGVIKRLRLAGFRLHIVFVPGNHGRRTEKLRTKRTVFHDSDWVMCHIGLKAALAKDDGIVWHWSEATDVSFKVHNTNCLLTHGYEFKFSSGNMTGPVPSVLRGNIKKQAFQNAVGAPYDLLFVGHGHTYAPGLDIVLNGSIIGYNEYAKSNLMRYQDPIQAGIFIHPERGPTINFPIFCTEKKG
jgi:hypothetical protein